MKILINQNEQYEFDIPNEMTSEEFLIFTDKIEKVIKFIKLSKFGNLNSFQKKFNERTDKIRTRKKNEYSKFHPNPLLNSREKILDLLQYGYHGTPQDKMRISKLFDKSWSEIAKRFQVFRKKYNIKPKEIGFITYNTKQGKGEKIPNYVIKSHSGIYDDNATTNTNTGNN